MPNDSGCPSGISGHSPYTIEEVLDNFVVLLEGETFEQELRALGIGRMRFLYRGRAIASLRALHVALWRLALLHSFPKEGEHICSLFLESLRNRAKTDRERTRFEAFEQEVLSYRELLKDRGADDFTAVAAHLVSRFRPGASDSAAIRLRLILLIRNAYTVIFDRLI